MYNLNIQFRSGGVCMQSISLLQNTGSLLNNSWDNLLYSNMFWRRLLKMPWLWNTYYKRLCQSSSKESNTFFILINEGFLYPNSLVFVVSILTYVIGSMFTSVFILHEETALNLLDLFSREATVVAHNGTVIWRKMNRKYWLKALWRCFLYCRKLKGLQEKVVNNVKSMTII